MSEAASVCKRMREKLTAALAPSLLTIDDESERHRGHAGYREGGATHFRIEIVAASFEGLSRVARHRRVYDILADELAGGVHALALTTDAPSERAAMR